MLLKCNSIHHICNYVISMFHYCCWNGGKTRFELRICNFPSIYDWLKCIWPDWWNVCLVGRWSIDPVELCISCLSSDWEHVIIRRHSWLLLYISSSQNRTRTSSPLTELRFCCDVHLVYDLFWPSWLHVGSGLGYVRNQLSGLFKWMICL